MAGCFVYENNTFGVPIDIGHISVPHPFNPAVRYAVDATISDMIYNPALHGFTIALEVHDHVRRQTISFLQYNTEPGNITAFGGFGHSFWGDTTSPKLAWDKKAEAIYITVEIDHTKFPTSNVLPCNRSNEQDQAERNAAGAMVAVLKVRKDAYQITPPTFLAAGFVSRRRNGLTIFYDEPRDKIAVTFTNQFLVRGNIRYNLWVFYMHISPEKGTIGGACQSHYRFTKSNGRSRPIRHQTAVFSPVNHASFILYENQKASRRWQLASFFTLSSSIERFHSDTPLRPVALYDQGCKCFLVCWQDQCGDVIHCQRYSPLQASRCQATQEGQCLARSNARPAGKDWCGYKNTTAAPPYCKTCTAPRSRMLVSDADLRSEGSLLDRSFQVSPSPAVGQLRSRESEEEPHICPRKNLFIFLSLEVFDKLTRPVVFSNSEKWQLNRDTHG